MILAELEHVVMLAILQLDEPRAIEIQRLLSAEAGREVARGSIYAALKRLTDRGLLTWEVEESTPARGGIPRRTYAVTEEGLEALRAAQRMVTRLSRGLRSILADG